MTDETKRNVQAWIDALRSGEYEQGTDMLKNAKTGCFCCLGVLADLEVKKGTATWEPDSLGAGYDYLVLPDGTSYTVDIPLAFNEKYGLTGESRCSCSSTMSGTTRSRRSPICWSASSSKAKPWTCSH